MACHYSPMNILVYNSQGTRAFLRYIPRSGIAASYDFHISQTKWQIICKVFVPVYTPISGVTFGSQLFHIITKGFLIDVKRFWLAGLLLIIPVLVCDLFTHFSFFKIYKLCNSLKYSDWPSCVIYKSDLCVLYVYTHVAFSEN